MIVTRGYLAGRIVSHGYGPGRPPALSLVDTSYKGALSRTFESLTRERTAKVLRKRSVAEK